MIWIPCKPNETCAHYSLKKGFQFPRLVDNPGPREELQSSKNQQEVPGPGVYKSNVLGSRANENDDTRSETDANYVPVSGTDENQLCNLQSTFLKGEMSVVARFLWKKTEKRFVGQVIGFDGEDQKKEKKYQKSHYLFLDRS